MGGEGGYLRRIQGGYSHLCPACGGMHRIMVERADAAGRRHEYDGNADRPSFTPSVEFKMIDETGVGHRCHYTLNDGMLIFHTDSTHSLAGMFVDLPRLPPGT